MAIGPIFYAVKVVRRDDGVTLEHATVFPDHERATMLLETFCEPHAEVVALRAVIREPGQWRAWHTTGEGGAHTGVYDLNGPDGKVIRFSDNRLAEAPALPWTAWRPDGRQLLDKRDRPRLFGSAIAACRALAAAMNADWRTVS